MRRERRKNDFASRPRIRVGRAWLAVWFLSSLSCLQAFAQGSGTNQAGRGVTISVERVRQLRKEVDLWPLVLHPTNTAERRINATLAHLNRNFAQKVGDCISGKFAWSKDLTPGEWRRTVRVTMLGPRFLSMVAEDGFYCGTAHPDDDLVVLVFILETGEQVDWSTLVPKSATASLPKYVLGDEDGTPPLMLPELQVIYAAAEETDCKDYFQDEQPFAIWPDAESGTLIAEVAGLPHVAAPCKNEFKLTIEQARKLGFDESLLLSIEEAHRIAASTAKPVPKKPVPTATTRPN